MLRLGGIDPADSEFDILSLCHVFKILLWRLWNELQVGLEKDVGWARLECLQKLVVLLALGSPSNA